MERRSMSFFGGTRWVGSGLLLMSRHMASFASCDVGIGLGLEGTIKVY